MSSQGLPSSEEELILDTGEQLINITEEATDSELGENVRRSLKIFGIGFMIIGALEIVLPMISLIKR